MGIAPIDLQTIYTQLDKVGKTYGSQAQLMQVQNAVQDAEKAKHQLEHNEKIKLYGQSLLANSTYKMFFKMDGQDLRDVVKTFGLTRKRGKSNKQC